MRTAVLTFFMLCACVPAPNDAPDLATELRELPQATNVSPPVAAADQVYRRSEFECGIALSYPAHWGVLTQEMDLNVQAGAQARGTLPRPSGSTTLLLLNSTPEPHGAQLRLVVEPADRDLTQEILPYLANDPATLQAMSDQLLQQLRTLEATGGARIVRMRPARVERLDNLAAIHMSYDRASALGGSDWRVDQYHIPVERVLIHFTISYRIDEEQQWSPILSASLASLEVGDGCHG